MTPHFGPMYTGSIGAIILIAAKQYRKSTPITICMYSTFITIHGMFWDLYFLFVMQVWVRKFQSLKYILVPKHLKKLLLSTFSVISSSWSWSVRCVQILFSSVLFIFLRSFLNIFMYIPLLQAVLLNRINIWVFIYLCKVRNFEIQPFVTLTGNISTKIWKENS